MEFTDYTGPLVTCSECAAAIPQDGMANHASWHLRMGHIKSLLTEEGRRRVLAGRQQSGR